MKKKFIYALAIVSGMALTACNGDYDDWAEPQHNEQEAAAAACGVTIEAGQQSVTDMATLEGDEIALVSLSSTNPAVTGFALRSFKVNGLEVPAQVKGDAIVMSASELAKIIEAAAGTRAYKTYDLTIESEVAANLTSGDAVVIKAVQTAGKFTTQPTPAEDAKGYYLLGDFTANSWDNTKPIWMTKQADGIYTATVTTKGEGDNWFKFYEGSHFSPEGNWDETNQGQMGCAVNGDGSMDGFIVWNGDVLNPGGVQTPVIKGQSTYEVTLDVNNMTYSVKRAEGKYYIIGNPNGWDINGNTCMAYCEGGNVYSYTTRFSNQWDIKFIEAKYLGTGDWGKCWGGVNGSTAASGDLVNTDAGAIGPNEQGGWYTFRFDMNTQTYTWTAIEAPTTEYTNISLIGGFNNWSADLELQALEKAPHNWYVRATFEADTELKFRANHGWDINWGTDGVNLAEKYYGQGVQGGVNIPVPAGTYDFYFNDITALWNIVAVE